MKDKLTLEEVKYLQEHDIDSDKGILYCDSAETYHLIMRMFCEGGGERREAISQAFLSHDWESYLLQVHSLKSTAKSVGANVLSKRARDLECATREENYKLVYEMHDALLERLQETVEIFAECLLKWEVI